MKHIVVFLQRVAYATTLALAGFFLAVMPAGVKIDGTGLLTKALDLPVAAGGLLLPRAWRGIDLLFDPQSFGYLHFSEVLLRHLRVAIPTYLLLFYLLGSLWGVVRQIRSRRRAVTGEGAAAEAQVPPPTR